MQLCTQNTLLAAKGGCICTPLIPPKSATAFRTWREIRRYQSIPEHKSEGDVEHLKKEFLKKLYSKKNVKPQSAQITFQHFDPEWEEYVDLEDDAVVPNNRKLKAIVTPHLSRLLTINGSPTTSRSILIIDSQVTICQ